MDESNLVYNNLTLQSFSNVSADSSSICIISPDYVNTICMNSGTTTCVSPNNLSCTYTDSDSVNVSQDHSSTMYNDSGSTCVSPDNFNAEHAETEKQSFSNVSVDSGSICYISPDYVNTICMNSGTTTCVSPNNLSSTYTDSDSIYVSQDHSSTIYKDSGSTCVSPDNFNTMYKDSGSTCVPPDNFNTIYKDSGSTSISPNHLSSMHMDSGSTCVSPDHSYVTLTPSVLNTVETFQNLNAYPCQEQDVHNDYSATPLSFSSSNSSLNDSSLDYSNLSNLSLSSTSSPESLTGKSETFKRPASATDEDILRMNPSKRSCESSNGSSHLEIGQRHKAASKNCCKIKLSRQDKQKKLDARLAELKREREDLLKQVKYLEAMTNEFRKYIKTLMNSISTV